MTNAEILKNAQVELDRDRAKVAAMPPSAEKIVKEIGCDIRGIVLTQYWEYELDLKGTQNGRGDTTEV
jgi:hypothetical protein